MSRLVREVEEGRDAFKPGRDRLREEVVRRREAEKVVLDMLARLDPTREYPESGGVDLPVDSSGHGADGHNPTVEDGDVDPPDGVGQGNETMPDPQVVQAPLSTWKRWDRPLSDPGHDFGRLMVCPVELAAWNRNARM